MSVGDGAAVTDCTPSVLTRWAETHGIAVAVGILSRTPSRPEESAGVRTLARRLFERAGIINVEVGRDANGAPTWPEAWIGSLAHSSGYVMAAIVKAKNGTGLGVDIELPSRLNRDMWPHVFTARESAALAGHDCLLSARRAAVAFAAKEAAYKALYPKYPDALGFLDTEVQFSSSSDWLLHVGTKGGLPSGLRIGGIHVDIGPMVATLCVIEP